MFVICFVLIRSWGYCFMFEFDNNVARVKHMVWALFRVVCVFAQRCSRKLTVVEQNMACRLIV